MSRTKPFQPIVVGVHHLEKDSLFHLLLISCWSQASCGPLVRKVTHEQFSSHLLSSALKCLLRNPDELMEGVSCFLCPPFSLSVAPLPLPSLSLSHLLTRDCVCLSPAAVAHLVSVLPLDCSKYAEDFVKNCIGKILQSTHP